MYVGNKNITDAVFNRVAAAVQELPEEVGIAVGLLQKGYENARDGKARIGNGNFLEDAGQAVGGLVRAFANTEAGGNLRRGYENAHSSQGGAPAVSNERSQQLPKDAAPHM